MTLSKIKFSLITHEALLLSIESFIANVIIMSVANMPFMLGAVMPSVIEPFKLAGGKYISLPQMSSTAIEGYAYKVLRVACCCCQKHIISSYASMIKIWFCMRSDV